MPRRIDGAVNEYNLPIGAGLLVERAVEAVPLARAHGIIMVAFNREALDGRSEGQTYTDAVVEGSASRLRPKLMTVRSTVWCTR